MSLFEKERSDYGFGKLDREDLLEDPFEQFKFWLQAAVEHEVPEPAGMCLSTCIDNRPSSRMVLLRGIDHGFLFYTNYLSRKGQEIENNPFGCLNFWWPTLERQIRIEGTIEKVSPEQSDEYFLSRPLESQIASAASPQSQIITSRDELEQAVNTLRESGITHRPDHWGGYRLLPTYFEFWQGRSARLHDRFAYNRDLREWQISRMAP
jgi:pyridoxamine 5'-phosphate oxidase